MTVRLSIGEDELSAFMDGELDQTRRAEIEAALAANAALAEHAALLASDKALLRKIYGPVADRPLPASWRARIEGRSRHRRLPYAYETIAAIAATLVITIAALVAWRQAPPPQSQDIVTLALDARNNVIRPEAVIATAALDVADKTLSQALRMKRKAPDLSGMGYRLAAVQIYAGKPGDKPVELVYRNAQSQVFTLYVRRPVGAPRTDMLETRGVRACVWQYDDLGAVMAGKMSWQEMFRLAGPAYSIFRT